MNKAELIGSIAENSGLSKADASKAVDAFVSVGHRRAFRWRPHLAGRLRLMVCRSARCPHRSQSTHG